jgi:aryl-alcohol dehydrogenase-like predicted oxidoreductase
MVDRASRPVRKSQTLHRPVTRAAVLRGALGAFGLLAGGGKLGAQAQTEKMDTRPIPSSGARLPVVGCGTWQTFDIGDSAADRGPRAEVLRVLFEAGGSVIDSSPMYGRSEAVVGDLLRDAKTRDKAFLATKVWIRGRREGIAQMQQSFARFQTDHVELMQVHNLLDWKTHLATLRGWKKEGRIRYLGVTHYTSSAYRELEAIMRNETLDFIQINYAMDDLGAEEKILPLAAARGIAVLINQPFGGGGLLRGLRDKPLPDWAKDIGCTSWAQILLKFVLGHPAVTCAIPGTSRPEHMRDNARAGMGAMPDAALRKKMIASLKA